MLALYTEIFTHGKDARNFFQNNIEVKVGEKCSRTRMTMMNYESEMTGT